jgi:molybdate transport system substrate-binding protein
LLIVLLAACAARTASTERTLTVFAAASLTDVLPEIGEAFNAAQEQEITFVYNFAGSSTLAAQLVEGAQADVYLSANPAQMARVQEAGLLAGEPQTFAGNRMMVAVPTENPADIQALDDLTREGVKIVTASEGVPVRSYTDTVLERLAADGYPADDFRANVVSEEPHVRQVVGKVSLGEADAAVVYQSDVTPQITDRVTALDIIPPAVNVQATYPAAALASGNTDLAQRYIDFLQTDTAQDIFASWGFVPIG